MVDPALTLKNYESAKVEVAVGKVVAGEHP
jgi:hypothetical protein